MYLPEHFREDRLDAKHELIRRHPLAMLISAGPTGLVANPVPFVLDATRGPQGTLLCHVARANPQWKAFTVPTECLVVFTGPEHYITPSWYATKRESGKVVPTWNYATVHAWGQPRVIDDPAWLRAQVDALTRQQETPFDEPWAVSDAPEPFVAAQLRGIVGLEIEIARLEGKWKVSQNRGEADRAGVTAGLLAGDARAKTMANLVAERTPDTTKS